ncbi:MAG: hypothetical protein GF400_06215 [Candidatus Eisenbacteria bacterium]|nr:hypothetical protein [Candidatus Eisenbacteria bacterium]
MLQKRETTGGAGPIGALCGRRFLCALAAALASLGVVLLLLPGCGTSSGPSEPLTREESIPDDAVKMTPETDHYPPVIHSAEWEEPVPLPGPVNTAGVEDAPVVTRDGQRFVFFFTPDGNLPAETQLVDGVSGVWWCETDRSGWGRAPANERAWTEPERAMLGGDPALDGPFCCPGDTLWFGSFRTGNYLTDGDIYTARFTGSGWTDVSNAGSQLNGDYNSGELAVAGDIMVFDRSGDGGYGGQDLWETHRTGRGWTEPENLGPVINSAGHESRPWLSADGDELWFTAWSQSGYAGPSVYRTTRAGTTWVEPEEIISNYSGDPGLDDAGNIYFTHLFYDTLGQKIEADIYVAYRR